MRITCGLLVIGTGCAQVFGIDNTSGASQSATLDVRRVSIGASVLTSPLDLGTAVPTFYAGAETKPGMLVMPGQWTTTLVGADEVGYKAPDLPTPFQHVFALSAPTIKTNFVAFEHPSPDVAPASSLVVDVTLPDPYAAGQTLEIAAIGAWTHHVLAGAEIPPLAATTVSTTIPYAMFTAMTASPAARITPDDVVVVLRRSGTTLTGALVVPPFDQAASSMIAGTMTAVTPDTPFDATVDPPTVATRYGALVPAVTGLSLAWRLDAAPGYEVGATTGVQLAGAAIPMASTSFSSSFIDPFTAQQWKPILTYLTSASRSFMLGGATTTFSASLTSYADPSAGLMLDLPAGIPKQIAIGQVALAADGMTAAIDPTAPLDIDITPDNLANTYYVATVEDIAVVGTSVTRTTIVTIGGPDPKLVLPANTLQHGHTYVIDAQCILGAFPQATTGDFQTFALPASVGTATSAVFTVAP